MWVNKKRISEWMNEWQDTFVKSFTFECKKSVGQYKVSANFNKISNKPKEPLVDHSLSSLDQRTPFLA